MSQLLHFKLLDLRAVLSCFASLCTGYSYPALSKFETPINSHCINDIMPMMTQASMSVIAQVYHPSFIGGKLLFFFF